MLVSIVIFILIASASFVIGHALLIRGISLLKLDLSNQKMLMIYSVLFNIPLVLVYFVMGSDLNLNNVIYILIVINSFIYFYFHFFNMSETARRIKILVGIYKNKIKTVSDISKHYNYDETLDVRLERLKQLSQIQMVQNSKYVLKSKFFYNISKVIMLFRRLFCFE